MDWTKFNNHGESSNHAFEVMCNILFKYWFKKEYKDNTVSFSVPSIIKKGYSVNPNTTKGKISWLTKFMFPIVLSLACIFALIVFYWN